MAISRRTVLAGAAAVLAGTADAATEPPLVGRDYAEARAGFRTRLIRKGRAPDSAGPLDPPPDAQALAYRSGGLDLMAWVSPSAGAPQPGLVFLHGAHALGPEHWLITTPWRRAGYATLLPALRAENGQGGAFSSFYDEVDDVLAATEAFAALPHVDPGRLFLAGHSVGATQALLAALASRRFRAVAAFSSNPDIRPFVRRFPEELVFDGHDAAEFAMRSSVCFADRFPCPVRIYHGVAEARLAAPSRLTAARAAKAGIDAAAEAVPGDHVSALPEEMRRSHAAFAALA